MIEHADDSRATHMPYQSPLRVDLMDTPSRQRLRNYLQTLLVSYHEDEHGQPTFAPDHRPFSVPRSPAAGPLRRPARGLVSLGSSPYTLVHRGLSAVLQISAEGQLTIWSGANFDAELLNVPLCKLMVQFPEDQAKGNMFVLSISPDPHCQVPVPSVWCRVRDRSKWLTIFRRRGVVPSPLSRDD